MPRDRDEGTATVRDRDEDMGMASGGDRSRDRDGDGDGVIGRDSTIRLGYGWGRMGTRIGTEARIGMGIGISGQRQGWG